MAEHYGCLFKEILALDNLPITEMIFQQFCKSSKLSFKPLDLLGLCSLTRGCNSLFRKQQQQDPQNLCKHSSLRKHTQQRNVCKLVKRKQTKTLPTFFNINCYLLNYDNVSIIINKYNVMDTISYQLFKSICLFQSSMYQAYTLDPRNTTL